MTVLDRNGAAAASPGARHRAGAVIRALVPGDFERWLPLWQDYQAFYQVDIPDTTTAVTFERLTGGHGAMAGALAVQDGRAVGFVHTIQHASCWTVGDSCYLQDLFVAADARGGGVGRALIEHVYAAAAAAGCARVHWLTHEANTAAMQLYDRVADRSGFVQYRRVLGG